MTQSPANPIYVIGHRNPDTDAIVSAMGYAELKRRTGMPAATAARLGDLWPETKYLLDRFELSLPVLLHDVYTRVEDVMNPQVQALPATATIREAAGPIRDKRIVPVTDEQQRLLGVVTLDDVAARYLEETDLASGIQSCISFESIVSTLDGDLLAGEIEGHWRGRVWVAATQAETLARVIEPGDLVVVGDRPDAQLAAVQAGAGCLVLVGNAEASEDVLRLARKLGTRIIATEHYSYRVTRLLNLSVPVTDVMRTDFPSVEADDLASEASEKLSSRMVIAMPVVQHDSTLVGIVSRGDLLRARGKGVILVDHNHSAQAVEGLTQANLIEVLDHHNLGDLRTAEPIYMKLEPVGSTSTIVTELFQEFEERPDPSIAGILAGGIISDTLLFRSPTTTTRDKAAGDWLASVAGVKLDELAQCMFRANSNYEGKTPAQIIGSNLKVYEWNGKRVGIGQAETVDIGYFSARQAEFRSELSRLKEDQGLHYALFLATDILAQDSVALLPGEGEEALIERAFRAPARDGCVELPGVVSRKKQVVPPLAREVG